MKDTSKIHVESEQLSSHKMLELVSDCFESISADTCLIGHILLAFRNDD